MGRAQPQLTWSRQCNQLATWCSVRPNMKALINGLVRAALLAGSTDTSFGGGPLYRQQSSGRLTLTG
jgi:hypothetical protein